MTSNKMSADQSQVIALNYRKRDSIFLTYVKQMCLRLDQKQPTKKFKAYLTQYADRADALEKELFQLQFDCKSKLNLTDLKVLEERLQQSLKKLIEISNQYVQQSETANVLVEQKASLLKKASYLIRSFYNPLIQRINIVSEDENYSYCLSSAYDSSSQDITQANSDKINEEIVYLNYLANQCIDGQQVLFLERRKYQQSQERILTRLKLIADAFQNKKRVICERNDQIYSEISSIIKKNKRLKEEQIRLQGRINTNKQQSIYLIQKIINLKSLLNQAQKAAKVVQEPKPLNIASSNQNGNNRLKPFERKNKKFVPRQKFFHPFQCLALLAIIALILFI